jgi:tetratricopeptide (TPR) repeat protein
MQGAVQEAVHTLNPIVEQEPTNAWAQAELGRCLKELGELRKALVAFQKAIEINENYAYAHVGIALVYGDLARNSVRKNEVLTARDQRAKAIKHLRRAIEIEPNGENGTYAAQLLRSNPYR